MSTREEALASLEWLAEWTAPTAGHTYDDIDHHASTIRSYLEGMGEPVAWAVFVRDEDNDEHHRFGPYSAPDVAHEKARDIGLDFADVKVVPLYAGPPLEET